MEDASPLPLPLPARNPVLAEQCAKPQSEPPLHVAMVPFPVHSHISALLELAKLLISKHDAVVSFINIKHHHDRLRATRLRGDGGEKDKDRLRFLCVDLEEVPPGRFDFTDIIPQFRDFHSALSSGMKDSLAQLFRSSACESPPLSCVCFGSMSSWAQGASAEAGLPSFFFWTQSAAVFSLYYHTPLLQANGFFPYTDSHKQAIQDEDMEGHDSSCVQNLISYVPGVPPLDASRFPTLLHVDDTSHPMYSTVKEQFSLLPGCQGVIFNSFEELEKECCRALRERLQVPVSFVGPLIPSAHMENRDDINACAGAAATTTTTTTATATEEKVECIEWLNHQEKHSVLYVSFGSMFRPSAADVEGLAVGIKASKQPFLWVARPTLSVKDAADMLPVGFTDDTKGQGLIIPWAPQLQVLSHPSVGAFLTHCGWNSTIESISMGVPVIPFPFSSDQPTNATYLCEIWKVGMEIVRHCDGPLRGSDVEEAIRKVFCGEEGLELRKRARDLQEAAQKAVRNGGSSAIHLQDWVQFARKCHIQD